jgi:hypothetical protein
MRPEFWLNLRSICALWLAHQEIGDQGSGREVSRGAMTRDTTIMLG